MSVFISLVPSAWQPPGNLSPGPVLRKEVFREAAGLVCVAGGAEQ